MKSVLALPLALLLAGPAAAQVEWPDPYQLPSQPVKLTPAKRTLIDQIRRQRGGDSRRFGNCTYLWESWKVQSNGVRTTTYSCDASEVVNDTISVSCSTLKLNSYGIAGPLGQTPERRSWGQWRLPEAGGEEQMVAALCTNVSPANANP